MPKQNGLWSREAVMWEICCKAFLMKENHNVSRWMWRENGWFPKIPELKVQFSAKCTGSGSLLSLSNMASISLRLMIHEFICAASRVLVHIFISLTSSWTPYRFILLVNTSCSRWSAFSNQQLGHLRALVILRLTFWRALGDKVDPSDYHLCWTDIQQMWLPWD